jgi:hypothetical protein
MPSASVMMAIKAKAGRFTSILKAYLKSWKKLSIRVLCEGPGSRIQIIGFTLLVRRNRGNEPAT